MKSEGGHESRVAAVSQESRSTLESARKGSAAIAPSVTASPHREDAAGVAPGPSDRPADVTEDEMADFIRTVSLLFDGNAREMAVKVLHAFTVGRR